MQQTVLVGDGVRGRKRRVVSRRCWMRDVGAHGPCVVADGGVHLCLLRQRTDEATCRCEEIECEHSCMQRGVWKRGDEEVNKE